MDNEFNQIFEIMTEAFPENEYRRYEEQKKLLLKDSYKMVLQKNDNDCVIAFILYWQFKEFVFIEHFAINKAYRGQGIGSEFLKKFIKNNEKKMIILEVELPNSETSKKRIKFYKKLGFNLNLYPYEQLPLKVDDYSIPMHIMSYPKELSENEFIYIRNKLYKDVYKA